MADFSGFIPTPTSSSGYQNVFQAPRIEVVETIYDSGDDINSRYIRNIANSSDIQTVNNTPQFSTSSTITQVVNSISRISSLLINRVVQSSIDNSFDEISIDVVNASIKTLTILAGKGIALHNVFSVVDGGISIEAHDKGWYFNFSFYSDGMATLYKDKEGEIPETWEYDFDALLNKINNI